MQIIQNLQRRFGPAGMAVLVIALLVVAGLLLRRNAGDPNVLPDKIPFVCVESGRIYELDRDELNAIPMRNPETGEKTLLPCVSDEEGFAVDRHYAAALSRLTERNHYVDPETLRVKTSL